MDKVGLFRARDNESTSQVTWTVHLEVKHPHGVQVSGQPVHHPLVADVVFVDERNRDFAAGFDLPFPLVIGEHRPVELAGVLPASPHGDCPLCSDCRAIPGQTVSVLVHDHARHVHAHIVVHVVPMSIPSGILGPGLPREGQGCRNAEQERPNHLRPPSTLYKRSHQHCKAAQQHSDDEPQQHGAAQPGRPTARFT